MSDPDDPALLESDRNPVVGDLTDFVRILVKTTRSQPRMGTCGSIFHTYRIPFGRIVAYTRLSLNSGWQNRNTERGCPSEGLPRSACPSSYLRTRFDVIANFGLPEVF